MRLRRNREGFTLIELMVALVMVAILAATLFASLRTALNAKATMDLKLEPGRTAGLAMEFLRTDFQNALQPAAVPAGSTSSATVKLIGNFQGTQQTDNRGAQADDVQFYTTSFAPRHVDGNGDVKEIEITVIPDPNSNDHLLVRKVLSNLTAEIQPTPDQEVVCRGVAGFGVRYYDGSEWLTNWDSTQEDNTIPAAVELTLQLTRPAGRGLPDQTMSFVRVFPLSCSTAALDTNVNSGISQ